LCANLDGEVLLVDDPFHGLDDAFEGRGLLDVSFDEYEQAKVPCIKEAGGMMTIIQGMM
jgi:hypothetical protein